MPLSKKSQIEGQVFIYLLSVILFGMILLYGYTAVKNLLSQSDLVETLQMKSYVESQIDGISYGDRKIIPVNVPQRFEKVCFMTTQLSAPDTVISGTSGPVSIYCNKADSDPIICNSWNDVRIDTNMFLIDGLASDMAYIGKFRVDNTNKYACMDVKAGKITLKLEGKGKYVALDEST